MQNRLNENRFEPATGEGVLQLDLAQYQINFDVIDEFKKNLIGLLDQETNQFQSSLDNKQEHFTNKHQEIMTNLATQIQSLADNSLSMPGTPVFKTIPDVEEIRKDKVN